MKVLTALLAGLTVVSAQSVMIGAPPAGAQLTVGQSTVVEIITPNFLSSSKEVSVAIGITSCASGFCPSPSDTLGNLLYSGPYNPQRVPGDPFLQPNQNFTVTIPGHLPKGPATIGVAHFALIGAGLQPWLETKNVSVVIQ
ncbi:hypothetical protein D9756_009644 [Leucocoprinus leucothites]|uniref:Uncharacterized protein n=1 Tax=Leucocoprinus leucothites TaxID=201217 RepID=A0A8H5CW83_9AGAR|nr:hypothetical protein D9756_009644 [Leucoagaricus leucothites]